MADAQPGGPLTANPIMRVNLTVTAGPHNGQVFGFADHDLFFVGRSKRAHLRLLEKDGKQGWYISRLHFMVELNPPRCRLLDLQSRNGTYVNGEKVAEANLHDGDEIRAGRTRLLVRIETEGATISHVSPPQPPESGITTTATPLLATTGPDDAPVIAGHRMVRELGRGGMGVVYLAEREDDGGQVAIKVINAAGACDRTQVERFLREARILRELDHPYIVAFREMGEAGEQLYFAMDYVPGMSAAQFLEKEGPLPVPTAVKIVCKLLQALEYAHAKKFVHRDIKPSNILVTVREGRRTIKLADFGLARVYQASQLSGLTVEGGMGGTLAYMPPEQVLNFRQVTPLADQYSAAATLYYLLTGEPLYDAKGSRLVRKILEEEPVPILRRRSDIDKGLAEVIHRALAREPENRFEDARTLRLALIRQVR